MKTFRFGSFALALPLLFAACITSESDSSNPEPECNEDNGCGYPIDCPDNADPTVHYISDDPAECGQTDCGPETDCVPCAGDQEYFETDCGCGCIDIPPALPVCPDPGDPTVHYISEDPAQCGLTDCGGPETDCIPCSGDQEYFQNECGCGCVDVVPPAPVCPDARDEAVHYISHNPAECIETDCGDETDCIPCGADQEYFDNECGCGCIDLGA